MPQTWLVALGISTRKVRKSSKGGAPIFCFPLGPISGLMGHATHMRTLSAILLIAVAMANVFFISCYSRTVKGLLDGGLETGGHSFAHSCYDLRDDINAVVWRPFPQAKQWLHSGWSLFHYGDAPEGTKAVLYFPSWYLFALAPAELLACVIPRLFSRRKLWPAGHPSEVPSARFAKRPRRGTNFPQAYPVESGSPRRGHLRDD